jgi:hypothetical protein
MTTTDIPPLQVVPLSEGRWVHDEQVARMIDMNRLRELTAELGFMSATTEGPDIDRHRQLNKNADYWLADRPDLVAARPGVRRGHGSGVPDYRRSGGRERRGQCSSDGDAFRWHVDRGVARAGSTRVATSSGWRWSGPTATRVSMWFRGRPEKIRSCVPWNCRPRRSPGRHGGGAGRYDR